MKSHFSTRLGLVVALSLATGIVTDAQTNWPNARTARPAPAPASSKPVQIRKQKPRRRGTAKAVTAAPQPDLLRSMAELVTRQAAAIEALARRLEAAESRLEMLASASPSNARAGQQASTEPATATSGFEDAQAPFRAALSIDWSEVIGR